jgi:hypothetical protein
MFTPTWSRGSKRILAWLACVLVTCATTVAFAAPEARILRIDPRASQAQGDPVLTTVIEVVENRRLADVTQGCGEARGDAQLDCLGAALDSKPLYTPFPFPHRNAIFTVTVDGSDLPAKYVRHARWGESVQKPGVGTAWLVLVDADKRMGKAFDDAKALALALVNALGPNDIINVMFFNDRQVVRDSKWIPAAQKARAATFVTSSDGPYASQGRNRALLTIIKNGATDGFRSLGGVGQSGINVPLHQAMVVISTGFGGADPSTTGPGAMQLQQYLTGGRFPEDNTALPKMPTPVISIFVPTPTFDEFRQNSVEFMQNLANPEIGGYFNVMRAGQGSRANNIVNAVRTRFSFMHVVEWRVSCLAPTVEQTFKLVFNNVTPPIIGDNTFKNVPMGVDPTTWPLDVNIDYSQKMAEHEGGVYPGGSLKVYGNFCWGGAKERAEVYFLPAGQPLPTALSGADVEKAKRTQQQLIAMGMKGETVEANDGFVEFRAPAKDKILHGSGNKAVVRLVVYDNKAHRVSGVTANRIIELKGTTQPFPLLWVLVAAFAFVVVVLLVLIAVRSGSKRRGAPPPAPVAAPPPGGYAPPGGYGPGTPGGPGGYGAGGAGGYGVPPGGYGVPPGAPPPGYGAAPGYAPPPGYGPPPGAPPGYPGGAPQAAPGFGPQGTAPVNPEFMYGSGGQPPKLGVTNDLPAQGAPPPNPYAAAPAVVSRAVLQGAGGVFTVLPGVEMRVGRDGAQCSILLAEPRVSGVHATVKLENGQLLVRDESSNNGTLVNGNRIGAGTWMPVPNGSLLRFGPAEFSVRLE